MTVVSRTITNWAVPRIAIVARLPMLPGWDACADERLLRSRDGTGPGASGTPEAHEPRDERDQENLPEQHFHAGEHPPRLAAGDQVAVARRGQRRVAEEE